jgi:uracil-DNA glycosylase
MEEDVDFEVTPDGEGEGKADYDSKRYAGSPLEFDRGPSQSWAELFARVPNYRVVSRELGATWLVPGADGKTKYQTVNEARALKDPPLAPIAQYTLEKDKFRYEMGPIFYRGRLDGTAKVLVVGQDAATDEALGHRAFVGGTGQKVQHFLNDIGITKSYVCANTFIYSIFEQYDEFTDELAMDGPIKEYRNDLIQKVWDENNIELIISFGSAAHDSVRKFRDERLGGKLPTNVEWVQMLHPGAAAIGLPPPGTTTEPVDMTMVLKVAESFARGSKRVWDARKRRGYNWLRPDSDGKKYASTKFYYMSDDVPYRDLPYGLSPEVGRGGTKSERAESGLQVQWRSTRGARYMAPRVPYPTTVEQKYAGFIPDPGDLSWEPPKARPMRYDPGPDAAMVDKLAKTPAATLVETETGISLATDFETPVWYRGRISGPAKVLVMMQDYGLDQFVAGRAATGDAGQKVAHLMQTIGVNLDYVMLNPFPYPVANVSPDQVATLAMSPSLAAFRNDLVDQLIRDKQIQTVITLGPVAEQAFGAVKFTGTWIKLQHPHEENTYSNWNGALPQLRQIFGGNGVNINYRWNSFKNMRVNIPREDLPWGHALWFGTSGDISQHPHESWIFWNAPRWMNREPPTR